MRAVRTTRCPQCRRDATRRTVRRHLRIGCTRGQREASRRRAAANQLQSPRQHPRPFGLRNCGSPSPPRLRSPPGTNDRPPNRAQPGRPLDTRRQCNVHRHSHPDFVFNTPGAGPSWPRAPSPPPAQPGHNEPPFCFYEDEWDDGILLDLDLDEGRPEGPALYQNALWLKGLAASDILKQELKAEIAHNGGTFFYFAFTLIFRLINTEQGDHFPTPTRKPFAALTTRSIPT